MLAESFHASAIGGNGGISLSRDEIELAVVAVLNRLAA
jgi:hypothetical protein